MGINEPRAYGAIGKIDQPCARGPLYGFAYFSDPIAINEDLHRPGQFFRHAVENLIANEHARVYFARGWFVSSRALYHCIRSIRSIDSKIGDDHHHPRFRPSRSHLRNSIRSPRSSFALSQLDSEQLERAYVGIESISLIEQETEHSVCFRINLSADISAFYGPQSIRE